VNFIHFIHEICVCVCVCVLCLSHFDISIILVGGPLCCWPKDVKPLVGFVHFNTINVVKVNLTSEFLSNRAKLL
jgi:hypothetical protein